MLCEARWHSPDKQICPHCGSYASHYFRSARIQWRCRDCDGYFSVTTKTPFENRKLPFKKIMMGLMLFVDAANGIAADSLARKLDIQVKTAHVFVSKLREVLFNCQDRTPLSGIVQIDGAHFGGVPRYGRRRKKSDRIVEVTDYVKGKIEHKNAANSESKPRSRTNRVNWDKRKNRRIVLTLREVSHIAGEGAIRTLTFICKSENSADATSIANKYIAPGAHIMTDENAAYNRLGDQIDLQTRKPKWQHDTVIHAIEFSSDEGINENQCESYNSRMRRWVKGVGHNATPKYLADRAAEFAWRDDQRRWSLKRRMDFLLEAIFNHDESLWWRCYWQGNHRQDEILYKNE